jgi:formylglycine-generating enzyme required for sulfatase activity
MNYSRGGGIVVRVPLLAFAIALAAVVVCGGPSRAKRHGAAGPARIKINPKDGAPMIYIPPGPFVMGDVDTLTAETNPRRTVVLSGYYIYKYDVTVAMYRKFCRATGHAMPQMPPWGWQDDHPIVDVAWLDAQAYCTWAGAHLPTEAQWEKAARGPNGRAFPWGNAWDSSDCVNSVHKSARGTEPVGARPADKSPYGVMDMGGNVCQWCSDWYDNSYCRSDHGADPAGPQSGTSRTIRGGCWHMDDVADFRAAHRGWGMPASTIDENGFRGAVGP